MSGWFVSKLTRGGGRSTSPDIVTTYNYAEPYYDTFRREVVGMRMSEVINQEGTISRSIYHLDAPIRGLGHISETIAGGKLLDSTIKTYPREGWYFKRGSRHAEDFSVILTEGLETTSNYDVDRDTGIAITQRSSFKNNIVILNGETVIETAEEIDYGLDAIGGNNDDLLTLRTYIHNTEENILNAPFVTNSISNGNSLGTVLNAYDGENWNVPPTKGRVTKQLSRLEISRWALTETRYDDWGNAIESYSPQDVEIGTPSETINYDSTYKTFVHTRSGREGQTVETLIDPGFGVPLKTRTAAGYLTCQTYDSFGRLYEAFDSSEVRSLSDNCDQLLARYTFIHSGDPQRQAVMHEGFNEFEILPASQSFTFFDGLGRKFKYAFRGTSSGEYQALLYDFDRLGRGTCTSQIQNIPNPLLDSSGELLNCFIMDSFRLTNFDPYGRLSSSTTYSLENPQGVVQSSQTYFMGSFPGIPELVTFTYTGSDGIEPADTKVVDAAGRLRVVARFDQSAKYEYDALGRLIWQDDPDVDGHRNISHYEYDLVGNQTRTYHLANRDDLSSGSNWITEYDQEQRVVAEQSPRGDEYDIRYHHDIEGRLRVKDFHPFNGLSNPGEEDHVFEYITDPTQFGYGAISSIETAQLIDQYQYDIRDNLMSRSRYYKNHDQTYVHTYQTDVMGLLRSETHPDGERIVKSYDGMRIRTIRSVQNGVYFDQFEIEPNKTQISYRAARGDFRTEINYGTINKELVGIRTTQNGVTHQDQTMNYSSESGALIGMSDLVSGHTMGMNFTDRGFLAAQATVQTSGGSSFHPFEYDDTGRMTRKAGQDLTYDQSLGYGPFAATRFSKSSGDVNYTYDARGNRRTKTNSAGREIYTWDSEDRLLRIQFPDGRRSAFRYDTFGNRISKVVVGSSGQILDHRLFVRKDFEVDLLTDEHTKYHFVGGRRVMMTRHLGRGETAEGTLLSSAAPFEFLGSEAIHSLEERLDLFLFFGFLLLLNFGFSVIRDPRQLVSAVMVIVLISPQLGYSGGVGGPGTTPGAPSSAIQTVHFLLDHQGSVIGAVESNGMVHGRVNYTAYGETASITNSQGNILSSLDEIPGKYKFHSHYYDSESGLYYMNARYYDPELGQFLSRDPASNDPVEYAFAAQNPGVLSDQNGELPLVPIILSAVFFFFALESNVTPRTVRDEIAMTVTGAKWFAGIARVAKPVTTPIKRSISYHTTTMKLRSALADESAVNAWLAMKRESLGNGQALIDDVLLTLKKADIGTFRSPRKNLPSDWNAYFAAEIRLGNMIDDRFFAGDKHGRFNHILQFGMAIDTGVVTGQEALHWMTRVSRRNWRRTVDFEPDDIALDIYDKIGRKYNYKASKYRRPENMAGAISATFPELMGGSSLAINTAAHISTRKGLSGFGASALNLSGAGGYLGQGLGVGLGSGPTASGFSGVQIYGSFSPGMFTDNYNGSLSTMSIGEHNAFLGIIGDLNSASQTDIGVIHPGGGLSLQYGGSLEIHNFNGSSWSGSIR